MTTKNNIKGMVDTQLISAFVKEWKESGMKGRGGKPDFCFECVGLKEGTQLFAAGSDKPIGEISKRPLLVRTNRVLIYGLNKEFATLQEAEFEYCKSIGKGKKIGSCTGWRFFRVRFDKQGKSTEMTIRGLWDLYPNIEQGIKIAIEKPSEKPAKPATKSTKKLVDESAALRAQVAELQKQLAELSKK